MCEVQDCLSEQRNQEEILKNVYDKNSSGEYASSKDNDKGNSKCECGQSGATATKRCCTWRRERRWQNSKFCRSSFSSDPAQGKGGAGSQCAGDNLGGEEEHQDSKSGEKVSSSPVKSLSGEGKGEGAVGKLRSSAYKPFGSSISINMSQSSDSSDSDDSNEDTICRGGPGKGACGIEVVNGDKGVQCDKCISWFHLSVRPSQSRLTMLSSPTNVSGGSV